MSVCNIFAYSCPARIVPNRDTITHLVNKRSHSYLDMNEYTTRLRIFEQFKEKDDFLRWLYHYSITIYKHFSQILNAESLIIRASVQLL